MPRPLSDEQVAAFRLSIQAIIDKREPSGLVLFRRLQRKRRKTTQPSSREVEMLKRSLGL